MNTLSHRKAPPRSRLGRVVGRIVFLMLGSSPVLIFFALPIIVDLSGVASPMPSFFNWERYRQTVDILPVALTLWLENDMTDYDVDVSYMRADCEIEATLSVRDGDIYAITERSNGPARPVLDPDTGCPGGPTYRTLLPPWVMVAVVENLKAKPREVYLDAEFDTQLGYVTYYRTYRFDHPDGDAVYVARFLQRSTRMIEAPTLASGVPSIPTVEQTELVMQRIRAQLPDAQALWTEQAFADYDVTVRRHTGLCDDTTRIQVRAGRLTGLLLDPSGGGNEVYYPFDLDACPGTLAQNKPLDAMFDRVADALNTTDAESGFVHVVFDAQYGFVALFEVGRFDQAQAHTVYTFTQFTPAPY